MRVDSDPEPVAIPKKTRTHSGITERRKNLNSSQWGNWGHFDGSRGTMWHLRSTFANLRHWLGFTGHYPDGFPMTVLHPFRCLLVPIVLC